MTKKRMLLKLGSVYFYNQALEERVFCADHLFAMDCLEYRVPILTQLYFPGSAVSSDRMRLTPPRSLQNATLMIYQGRLQIRGIEVTGPSRPLHPSLKHRLRFRHCYLQCLKKDSYLE